MDKASRRKPKPAEPTRLLIIRHAEVERSYHKIFGGRIDMNLSPRGRAQARRLAKFLRTRKIDALYASPMKRVQQTLAPFLKNWNADADESCAACARWISATGPG